MVRMFQIKNQDSLGKLLPAGSNAATASPAMQRLQQLNPHVDFAKLKAGTVLLLPEGADFDPDQGEPLAGEAFDGLAGDAVAGLKGSGERLRAGIARRDAQRKDVSAVLKSAAIKRVLDADPALRKQADDADARFKAEQKDAADSAAQLGAMEQALGDELAALGKLFK